MHYIAFVTKGLEQIALAELQRLDSDAQIEEVATKRIIFTSQKPITDLIKLRSVDDLGLVITSLNDFRSIDQIGQALDAVDLKDSNPSGNFSITVSAAMNKVSADDITKTVVDYFTQKYGWQWQELERSDFDIRVFIDQKKGYISVRATETSLRHRLYKVHAKAGSLKPTVAAAMVQAATNFQKDLKIVDNFCGSGTILCEAYLQGQLVYGGDLDPESVTNTQKNLQNTGYKFIDRIYNLDAATTQWPDHFFDLAISNLPWGHQIEIHQLMQLYEDSVMEYQRILKPNGRLCLLVIKPELMKKFLRRYFPKKEIKEYPIGLLGQNPTILLVS